MGFEYRHRENMHQWLREQSLKDALYAWDLEIDEMDRRFFYYRGNRLSIVATAQDALDEGWFLSKIGMEADTILRLALRDRLEEEKRRSFSPFASIAHEDLEEVLGGIRWLVASRLLAEGIGLPREWDTAALGESHEFPAWLKNKEEWLIWPMSMDRVSPFGVLTGVPSDLWRLIARDRFATLLRQTVVNLKFLDSVLSENPILDFMFQGFDLRFFGMGAVECLIRLSHWCQGVVGAMDQTIPARGSDLRIERSVPDADISITAYGRDRYFCGTGFSGFDASEYIKYLLLEEYGFECGFGEFTLVRFVDDEHYLTVNLPGCSIYSGPMGFCEVELGVGRRDIGELMSLLGFDISGLPVETVLWESAIAPFGGRDRFKFRNCEVTRSELKGLVEQMLGKVEHCANISYLEEYVEFKPALGTNYEKTRHLAAVLPVKICNSLLNGWDSVADLPALNRYEKLYRSMSDTEEWQTHIDRVLERVHKWRAKFPNGVERKVYQTEFSNHDGGISVDAVEGAVRAGGVVKVEQGLYAEKLNARTVVECERLVRDIKFRGNELREKDSDHFKYQMSTIKCDMGVQMGDSDDARVNLHRFEKNIFNRSLERGFIAFNVNLERFVFPPYYSWEYISQRHNGVSRKVSERYVVYLDSKRPDYFDGDFNQRLADGEDPESVRRAVKQARDEIFETPSLGYEKQEPHRWVCLFDEPYRYLEIIYPDRLIEDFVERLEKVGIYATIYPPMSVEIYDPKNEFQ